MALASSGRRRTLAPSWRQSSCLHVTVVTVEVGCAAAAVRVLTGVRCRILVLGERMAAFADHADRVIGGFRERQVHRQIPSVPSVAGWSSHPQAVPA